MASIIESPAPPAQKGFAFLAFAAAGWQPHRPCFRVIVGKSVAVPHGRASHDAAGDRDAQQVPTAWPSLSRLAQRRSAVEERRLDVEATMPATGCGSAERSYQPMPRETPWSAGYTHLFTIQVIIHTDVDEIIAWSKFPGWRGDSRIFWKLSKTSGFLLTSTQPFIRCLASCSYLSLAC